MLPTADEPRLQGASPDNLAACADLQGDAVTLIDVFLAKINELLEASSPGARREVVRAIIELQRILTERSLRKDVG